MSHIVSVLLLTFLLLPLGLAQGQSPVYDYTLLDPPDPDLAGRLLELRSLRDGEYLGEGFVRGYRLSSILEPTPILCDNFNRTAGTSRTGPEVLDMNSSGVVLLADLDVALVNYAGIQTPDGTCTYFPLPDGMEGMLATSIDNEGTIEGRVWVPTAVERTVKRFQRFRREVDGTVTVFAPLEPDSATFITSHQGDVRVGYVYRNITPQNRYTYDGLMCVGATCRFLLTADGADVWMLSVNDQRRALCVEGTNGFVAGRPCLYDWDSDTFHFFDPPPGAVQTIAAKVLSDGRWVGLVRDGGTHAVLAVPQMAATPPPPPEEKRRKHEPRERRPRR